MLAGNGSTQPFAALQDRPLRTGENRQKAVFGRRRRLRHHRCANAMIGVECAFTREIVCEPSELFGAGWPLG
jgi:hypothetical protein